MIRLLAHLAILCLLGCGSTSLVSISEVTNLSQDDPEAGVVEAFPEISSPSSRSVGDGRIPGLELLRLRFDANGSMPDRLVEFLGEERSKPDGLGLLRQRMDDLEARALVATLGPPRAAIESSLGEVRSFEPMFAEVSARKRRAVIVNGRPRLVEGGRLALELRGWIRLHEDGPRVAGELELAHRSGPAFRPIRNVMDHSSFELEADEVLFIAPANARAISSGPGPSASVAAPAGRHLLVVGDEVEVILIRPVVPDILLPLNSSPE
ncbi:MAG: hypothetical protein CMJ28_01480 [Phycisphaerae bacterium]|nr:hypothetical protein [Phycisphaerae bacterium]